MKDHVTIFPDTNTLLHYPPLKDVDWLKVANAKVVKLVFCMQVIHELDEKKNDSRLGGRAKRTIKEIDTLESSDGLVRDGVTLEVFNHELRAADFPASLSPDSKDDRIVHLMKKYAESHAGEPIIVYTEDYGMSVRCKSNGIAVIKPDDSRRLPDPQSELEKKYKALFTENSQLKNRGPVIEVRVIVPDAPGDDPSRIALSHAKAVDVNALVDQERLALGAVDASGFNKKFRSTPLSAIYEAPTMADWERYRINCQEYIEKYKEWCAANVLVEAAQSLNFSFEIEVANTGTAAGDDVLVDLRLPPVLKFITDDDELVGDRETAPAKPTRPEEPSLRLPVSERIARQAIAGPRSYELLRSAGLRAMNAIGRHDSGVEVSGEIGTGFRIRLFLPKMNHHLKTRFGPFTTAFFCWENAKSFEGDLAIIAANMVKMVESKLPFTVTVKE